MRPNDRKEQDKNYDKSKSLSTTAVLKGQINPSTKVVEEPKNNIDLNTREKDEKIKKLKERLNASKKTENQEKKIEISEDNVVNGLNTEKEEFNKKAVNQPIANNRERNRENPCK